MIGTGVGVRNNDVRIKAQMANSNSGAAGFVGSNLKQQLADAPKAVEPGASDRARGTEARRSVLLWSARVLVDRTLR